MKQGGVLIAILVLAAIALVYYWKQRQKNFVYKTVEQGLDKQIAMSQKLATTLAPEALLQDGYKFLSDIGLGSQVSVDLIKNKVAERAKDVGHTSPTEGDVRYAVQQMLFDYKKAVYLDTGWSPQDALATIQRSGIIAGFSSKVDKEKLNKEKHVWEFKGKVMGKPFETTISDALVTDFVREINPIISQETNHKLLWFNDGGAFPHVLVPAQKYEELQTSKFVNPK